MRIAKTTDTGNVGDLCRLSDELLSAAPLFELATDGVSGELFIVFRSLPGAYQRRSTVRYSTADDVLYLDLAVAEEDIVDLTLDEQRAVLRAGLTDLIDRGLKSRSARWSPAQRSEIRTAFNTMLHSFADRT